MSEKTDLHNHMIEGFVKNINRKGCPFCGGGPYYPTKIKKNKAITACANGKCSIFGVNMTIKQWETRYK